MASQKLQAFWNHPSGPKTIHFWAPAFKWGLTVANVADFEKPTEQVSYLQQSAVSDSECSYVEGSKSELLNASVDGELEAYMLYNQYSYKHGFGIRRTKTDWNKKREITGKEFVCHMNGVKNYKKAESSTFNRLTKRTGCKARIRFHVIEGKYVAVTHDMVHNHEMVPQDKMHLIPSHRGVSDAEVDTVSKMKESGIGVAKAYRLLSKEAGGDQNMNFTERDLYNALARHKANQSAGGCDAKDLLDILINRQVENPQFYYSMEVDHTYRLKSLFYRDDRMKRDYELFGDVVVFDTTFNTNKWGMLLAPFIGINHNGKNVVFGVGFVPQEDTDSMTWLFSTFRASMHGKCPQTFMTDQAPGIAAGLLASFPESKHRLCTWHIRQNAMAHLKKYWGMKGFSLSFDYILKYTNTEAEFNHFWSRLMETYDCGDCAWLQHLYSIRKFWCPAFNKEVFSGGILSSQKCESTNSSVKNRVGKTDSLVAVYTALQDIIIKWRAEENQMDYDTMTGSMMSLYGKVPIVVHARRIYTITMATYFARQYGKSIECLHKLTYFDGDQIYAYQVWRNEVDYIRHQVVLHSGSKLLKCTCNMYTEVGILCQHCLKVMTLHCIVEIPVPYIYDRWTKKAMCRNEVDIAPATLEPMTVWRSQNAKNFMNLINCSATEISARLVIEKAYADVMHQLHNIVHIPEPDEDVVVQTSKRKKVNNQPPIDAGSSTTPEVLLSTIQNPASRIPKYSASARYKSVVEKIFSKKNKGWHKKRDIAESVMRAKAQRTLDHYFKKSGPLTGTIVHPLDSDMPLEWHES